jgi:hypothetical protein
LLRLNFFFGSYVYAPTEQDSFFTKGLFGFLESLPWLSYILTIIVLFSLALNTNRMIMNYRVNRDQNLFPALMLVLFCSISENFNMLNPVMLSMLFLSFSLLNLLKIYKKQKVTGSLINAGFFLALSQLFYPSAIVFIIAGFAGILIVRSQDPKEFFQYLSGWVAVFFLLFTYAFWNENLVLFSSQFSFSNAFHSFKFANSHIAISSIISLMIWIVLVILSSNYFSKKKNLQEVKNLNIIYWVFFASLLSLFFAGTIQENHLLMIAIPSAVFASFYLENIKRVLLIEGLHLFILMLIFFFQFQ